jgi:hypothetical protein
LSFSDIESVLGTISSLTVIAGAVIVVIQLRINFKHARSQNSFNLIGRVIDPSFAARRHRLYEVSAKYAGNDWQGFNRSLDDFEVRNFANIYEQLGILVKKGVLDLKEVLEAVSAQPLADWRVFEPIRKHIISEAAAAFPSLAEDSPGIDAIYWPNFKWLAGECGKWVQSQLAAAPAQLSQQSSD